MNDLAEKALHGLDVARREVAARPVVGLSVVGFVLSAVIVYTGGRIGAAPAAVPLNHWLGLLPAAGYRVTDVGMGTTMLAAIGLLLALWVLTIRIVRARACRPRAVWIIAGAWAAPFAVGPPLLSTDVYEYVAHGLLARRGHSPYHYGADHLGDLRVVNAIDPSFRSERSTDGPLTSLADHLAVSVMGGSTLAALILLRVVAILSVVVIARQAAELAPSRRTTALCLTALNPGLLLYVVSAAQFDGVLVALLVAALVAAHHRHWTRAIVLACLAAGIKPVALVALPALVAVHVIGQPIRNRLRIALRDSMIAIIALVVVAYSVPFGLGWIGNLGAAMHAHIAFAPASVVGDLVAFVVPSASYDDLAIGGRIAAGAAGVTTLAYLYATVRSRPVERTVGYGLLAAGILAPVVYPTYLLWGTLCIAPTAIGARRDWVIALSCAACVLAPVGLGDRGADYATTVALAVIAAALLPTLYLRYRREHPTPITPVSAAG